jgi:hypothetical protein
MTTTTTNATEAAKKQDENEVLLKQTVGTISTLLNHDLNRLKPGIQLNVENLKYNAKNINKHGVVILTGDEYKDKDDDLPSWLMQAMTTLVHWHDFHNSTANYQIKPSFIDIFTEIKSYFHNMSKVVDKPDVLLTSQLGELLVLIMKHVNERNNVTIRATRPSNANDDDDNDYDDEIGDGAGGECCSSCLDNYDFLNTWLDCNAIEFNEFFINLNMNCGGGNIDDLASLYMDQESYDNESISQDSDTSSNSNHKLRRNNSFIAAITDSSNQLKAGQSESTASLNSTNGTENRTLSKTQSMDFISNSYTKLTNAASKRRTPSFHQVMQYHQRAARKRSTIDLNNDEVLRLINIYRVVLMFLPPINKRKLHLLLRLLYKLKLNSQYTRYYLANETQMTTGQTNVTDSVESIVRTCLLFYFNSQHVSIPGWPWVLDEAISSTLKDNPRFDQQSSSKSIFSRFV